MYVDYFTTAALVDELNATLVGGRLQAILEIDDLSLGLEIYHERQRHYLYLTADPERARLHLTEGKLRRGVTTPAPLGLLLRRYLDGARVVAVTQPPWERIVNLDFLTPEGEFTLVVEPMERRANLVLVENGTIRECIRRVGADENRVRQLLPGKPYQAPPPQTGKLEPGVLTEDLLGAVLRQAGDAKLPQALAGAVLGISPLLGREIAYQATGKPDARAISVDPAAVWESYQRLVMPLLAREWQPGVAQVGEVYARLGRCQIAVSEGVADKDGTPIASTLFQGETDAHGNVQLSGTGALGDALAQLLKDKLKTASGKAPRVRADTFGYLATVLA
ncbi:MAG: hypothetical protein HC915_19880, partial [Anaerolineae bacterium]|nr:hypothetical protein [Anaerolineae bacterium]